MIGFTAGIPQLPLNLTLLKSCQVIGVFYGAMISKQPELLAEITRDLDGYMDAGDLKPFVSARYALAEAPRALRDLLDRKVTGKVVIEAHR